MARLIDKLKKEVKKHKPKTKAVTLHLLDEYVEALNIIAMATDRSRSQIVMDALDEVKITDKDTLEYFKNIIKEKESSDINNNVDNNDNNTQDRSFGM